MPSLSNRTVSSSYTELLKINETNGLTSILARVEDGDGTFSALSLSTSKIRSDGDLEVTGTSNLWTLDVTDTSTLRGDVSMAGNLTVAGNAVIQGTLTANGGTLTFGDADTDNVVFNADVNSHILPNTDDTYDLGSPSKEWRNLYVDGTAFIDTLSVDNLTATTSQLISATTQSTDKDTGALVVEGGVGVEKNANIGGNLGVTGTTSLTGNATLTGDLAVNGGDLTTSQATFNLLNTTALTLNIGGASTLVDIGASTGTTSVNNNLSVDLDLEVKGGDLTTNQTTFNLLNTTATTLNVGGAATAISLGAATGTTTVNHSLTVAGGTGQSFIVNDGTTSRFTVDSTNGNTSISGTLGVTGAASLSSTLGVADTISATKASGTGLSVTSNATIGGTLGVTGATSLSSTLAVSGDVSVNTNKFKVVASSGNTSVAGTLGVTGATTLSSNLGVTGDTTLTGNLTANANTTLGNDATADTVTFNSRIASGLVPSTDDTRDLGSATLEWKDLYIDGTANIDSLVADTADINAGTIDAVTIGTSSPVTDLRVDNLRLDGNTVSSTDTNGNIVLDPNGTGIVSVTKDLTVTGNLTVNGATTNINTTNLVVEDKNVILADVATPSNTTADGGGITLKGSTDKTINWVNATGAWTSSEDFNLVSGKVYEINGASVLSATTLGSGVTSSSLTSVGTIGTGTWQGSVVAGQYGGTGVNNSGKTITLGGNLTTSGAHTTTLTTTGNTSVTLPTTGTLATVAGTETLTNKTLTTPTINTPVLTVNDADLTIQDNTDAAKKAKFEASGISSGQTRTYTLPNVNMNVAGYTTVGTPAWTIDQAFTGFLNLTLADGTTVKVPYY